VPEPTLMCDPNLQVGEEFVHFRPFKSNAYLPGGGAPIYNYTQQLARLAPKLAKGTQPSTGQNDEYGNQAASDVCGAS
jgi:hypothetical protein